MLSIVLAICLPIQARAIDTGRPPLQVPSDLTLVVERLPRGYAALEPTRSQARDPAPDLAQVGRLVEVATRSGDARLAARAEALLDRVPPGQDPATLLRLRAFLAQHRHDFHGAIAHLDALLARWPRDGDARLARAQVHLVQGRIAQARGDCVVLALGVDAGRALLCGASLAQRQGREAQAARALETWLAQAPASDALRRFALVMRAEIASQAGEPRADDWFRQALALAPDDVRTLAAYARHLRAAGRPADTWRLLAGAPGNDTLQLERVLAAQALHRRDAAALAAGLARRYAQAYAAGARPEIREEAEFALVVRGDARRALRLALQNFRDQRDREDVDILVRAAHASGQPQALAEARAWAAREQVPLPDAPQVTAP